MFCPHAGGAASFFAPFVRHFPAGFDLSAVQYPGRQERLDEPLVPTVESLADHLLPILRQFATAPVPLVIFGHSMGASVAFETALRLAAEEPVAPCRLVVSGRSAPSVPRVHAYATTDREILDDLARLGGTQAQFVNDPEIMEVFLPSLRNDYGAVARYRPSGEAVLDAPLLCLTGEQDPRVSPEEAAAWKTHTSAEFRLESFPGGHFFLSDHREAVARTVADWAGSSHGDPSTAAGA
ncbi:thioesterase II family protein [Streptomyces sp. NPDC006259]|uniref:thioesterase II family protein n=1 Tax=Streptomyces sp. NPDC006259 TaxID=3364740 RepID=UPI0036959BC9